LIFFFFLLTFPAFSPQPNGKHSKKKKKKTTKKPGSGGKGPNLTQKQLKKGDLERRSKGNIEKNLRKPYD
jgi:hypothetical protein